MRNPRRNAWLDSFAHQSLHRSLFFLSSGCRFSTLLRYKRNNHASQIDRFAFEINHCLYYVYAIGIKGDNFLVLYSKHWAKRLIHCLKLPNVESI